MRDADVRMVMRSVYLPEDMDEGLRAAAFKQRISKSELIRQFLEAGLVRFAQQLNEERARRADILNKAEPDRNPARSWMEAGSAASAAAMSAASAAAMIAFEPPAETTSTERETSQKPGFMSGV